MINWLLLYHSYNFSEGLKCFIIFKNVYGSEEISGDVDYTRLAQNWAWLKLGVEYIEVHYIILSTFFIYLKFSPIQSFKKQKDSF